MCETLRCEVDIFAQFSFVLTHQFNARGQFENRRHNEIPWCVGCTYFVFDLSLEMKLVCDKMYICRLWLCVFQAFKVFFVYVSMSGTPNLFLFVRLVIADCCVSKKNVFFFPSKSHEYVGFLYLSLACLGTFSASLFELCSTERYQSICVFLG